MGRKGKKKGGEKALPVGMSGDTQQSGQPGGRQHIASSGGRQQSAASSSQQSGQPGIRQTGSSSGRQQSTAGTSQQSGQPGMRQTASSSGWSQPIQRTSQQSVHAVTSQKTEDKPDRQEVSPERLALEFERFRLSTPLPRKPGINQSGKPIGLISNCFPLKIPSGNVYHYDVEIFLNRRSTTTMEKKTDPKDKKFRCLNSRENRKIFEKMVREHPVFESILPAFDGKKNMYTRKPLRFNTKELKCKVVIPDPGGQRDKEFEVFIKPVEKKDTQDCAISLDPLHALFAGRVSSVPRETIMAIETVMKHCPALRHVPLGQSFFYPPRHPHPLGSCKEIWFGYHQSVRLGQKTPMVNLDISASTFYEKGPLENYIATYLDTSVERLRSVTRIEARIRQNLNKLLKNLRVETKHTGYRREHRIIKLTDKNASSLEFTITLPNGSTENTTIAAYYAKRYKRTLMFPNLPCVQMHPITKNNFIPIELCEVIAGQRYNGLLQGEETAKMVRDTARPPNDRFREIKTIFNEEAKYNQDPVLREFGLSVNHEPLRVAGRRIIEPTLKYHEHSRNSIVKPFNGSWDMRDKKVLEGASVHSWALVDFAGKHMNSLGGFADALSSFGGRQGMYIGKCRKISPQRVPRDVNYFDSFVEGIFRNLKRDHQIDMVVAIIPMKLPRESPRDDDKTKVLYRTVKDVSMRLGIISQCVKEKNVTENPSLVANILLKVNAKMGGTNNSLTIGEMPGFMREGMMIVGADVTHPSPSKDIACSLAAVVGSVNPEFSTYEVVARAQINKADSKISKEVIDDMTAIMVELLAAYKKRNGRNPSRIVIFRDGVSDGEFEEVQEKEVNKIKEAFRLVQVNYNPGITYIVMQKRHHVRMMPENPRDSVGRMGNPPPGTVVDTVITHPLNYDFYMYGHFGLQGTSRPTYLTVVKDDNTISPVDLHKMCYYLCHTYARCTKSISSPAPARYADLAAFMARQILLKHKSSRAEGGAVEDFEESKLSKSDLTEINNLLKAMKFEHIV